MVEPTPPSQFWLFASQNQIFSFGGRVLFYKVMFDLFLLGICFPIILSDFEIEIKINQNVFDSAIILQLFCCTRE